MIWKYAGIAENESPESFYVTDMRPNMCLNIVLAQKKEVNQVKNMLEKHSKAQ